jgi:signal transduction histidine kinase
VANLTGATESSTRTSRRPQRRVHPTVQQTVESVMLAERTRWAMHVHDGLTQSVTSAVLEIQTLRHRIEVDPQAAIETLAEVEAAIRADLREIRTLLFELQEGGDLPAGPSFAGFISELVDRWHIPARVSVEGDVEDAPGDVLETAHGIVAEALANAAKHSGAPEVAIRVRTGAGELRIEVEDRGSGIVVTSDEDPHFGMRHMRERAERLGGTVEIESTPGAGTKVVAVLPVGGRGE